MCSGGAPKVDDTAQRMQLDASREARAKEEARTMRMGIGRSFLDAIFDGGEVSLPGNMPEVVAANPDAEVGQRRYTIAGPGEFPETHTFAGYEPYLEDRRNTLSRFYMPQLQDQYGDANDALKYGLARSGQSASSQGAEAYGDLINEHDLQRSATLSRIDQDVSKTRQRFESTRGALEDMLLQTGDAARVADRATGQLNNLYAETPETPALGDVFAASVGGYQSYGTGVQQGRIQGIYDQPSITQRANSRGSGKKIA